MIHPREHEATICIDIEDESSHAYTYINKSQGIGVALRSDGVKCYRSTSNQARSYKDKESAFLEYKACKERRLVLMAEKYKKVLSKEAYEGLYRYRVEETD